MRFVKRVAVCLTVVFALALSARASVFEQVPEQALVVIKVTNMESASAKFAKFSQDLGLAMMVPMLNDPLAAFMERLGVTNGVDKGGDFAFALIDPAASGVEEDKSMLMLLPVSDYQAFIGNFPGAKTDGAATEIIMPQNNQPAFVASWGKYAVLSPAAEIVKMKPAGIKLAGQVTTREASAKDIVVMANIPALKTKFAVDLKDGREKMLSEVENELSRNPDMAKFSPVARSAINQMMNFVDRFFEEAQGAVLGISFTDAGIVSTAVAEFHPGTYLGGIASAMKNSDAPQLAGLPDAKYLMYGGGLNDAETVNKLVDDALAPILKELSTADPNIAAPVEKYIANLKAYTNAAKSGAMGMVAPSGALGQEAIFQFVTVAQGDAQTMKKAYGEMMSTQGDLMSAFGGEQMKNMFSVETTPAAKTYGGVEFDVLKTNFNVPENDPQAAQMKQGLQMMYGPDGMSVLLGATGDTFIFGTGASDETMESLVAAAKENKDVLSELAKVKDVSSKLPAKRISSMYIALDEIARTAGSYAAMFGAPIDVQLPPDLAPIGVSIASEGSAVRVDTFTSTETLKSIVAAGMQAGMQMQQGRRQGGGPL